MLILPPEPIRETLRALRHAGWTLAVATGRTREELLPTLQRFGLLELFNPRRIVTHDEISQAEAALSGADHAVHLSKPAPFPFLRAIFPDAEPAALASGEIGAVPLGTIFVGDTVGDMAPARRLGARGVAVLTGPGGASAEPALREAGATDVITDLTELPALLGTGTV
jgi:phosphoglycolate phosphatase-like HAD superfamily hydrolase